MNLWWGIFSPLIIHLFSYVFAQGKGIFLTEQKIGTSLVDDIVQLPFHSPYKPTHLSVASRRGFLGIVKKIPLLLTLSFSIIIFECILLHGHKADVNSAGDGYIARKVIDLKDCHYRHFNLTRTKSHMLLMSDIKCKMEGLLCTWIYLGAYRRNSACVYIELGSTMVLGLTLGSLVREDISGSKWLSYIEWQVWLRPDNDQETGWWPFLGTGLDSKGDSQRVSYCPGRMAHYSLTVCEESEPHKKSLGLTYSWRFHGNHATWKTPGEICVVIERLWCDNRR